MDQFSKKGFQISVSLHALLFVVLILAFMLSHCSSRRKSHHVFQLEQVPGKSGAMTAATKPTTPAPAIPVVAATPPVTKAAPVPKESIAKPIPQKVAQETKMSYQDFVKSQGKPVVKESKVVAAQPVVTPKIQAPDIKKKFEQKLSSVEALNGGVGGIVGSGGMGDYQDYVRSVIDSGWRQPEDFSGYTNPALFEFDIDKLGRICNVRVLKSSGSNIFDESVRLAFTRANSLRPTPDGRTFAGCRLTFTKKSKVL